MNDEGIKQALLTSGWQSTDIEEAFNSIISPNQPSQPKKLNKVLLATIIFVIGVLIMGGGAFGYIYYFPSPEKIVQKMTAKMAEIKSLEYSGEVKVSGSAGDLLNGSSNLLQSAQSTSTKKIISPLISLKYLLLYITKFSHHHYSM